MDRTAFLNPSTYFAAACVAFSALAISSVWRNQQAAQPQEQTYSRHGKATESRPQPKRRRAVDSVLYIGEEESPQARLNTLIASCARISQLLQHAWNVTASRMTVTALLGELSVVTTSLGRLEHAASANARLLSEGSVVIASFRAFASTLTSLLTALEDEVKASDMSEDVARSAVQQLRDQRPSLDFLLETVGSAGMPPTPPSEGLLSAAWRPDTASSSSFMHPPTPSTGLTPAVDAKGWIEPPPEYSPPTDPEIVLLAEKGDKKSAEVAAAESQDEVADEVYDTDALYNAVTNSDADLMNDFLRLGAEANEAIGELQRTPLHQAAHLNHVGCLAILLRHGVDIAIEDAKGDTALHLAAWAGHCEALSALLAHGADVDWLSGRDGYSPLWCAVSAYHIDAARLLLREGARVGLRSPSGGGLLPLHQAAVTGQSAMCELLLERGAQVDWLDDDKNTALHYAAVSGSVPCVKALLRSGADVHASQAQGLTAGHWAAHKGHAEVLELLLAYGAPLDAEAEDGATPLHMAANRGHMQPARLLLEKGARRNLWAAWDGAEGTPADMAKAKGHAMLAKLLLTKVK